MKAEPRGNENRSQNWCSLSCIFDRFFVLQKRPKLSRCSSTESASHPTQAHHLSSKECFKWGKTISTSIFSSLSSSSTFTTPTNTLPLKVKPNYRVVQVESSSVWLEFTTSAAAGIASCTSFELWQMHKSLFFTCFAGNSWAIIFHLSASFFPCESKAGWPGQLTDRERETTIVANRFHFEFDRRVQTACHKCGKNVFMFQSATLTTTNKSMSRFSN